MEFKDIATVTGKGGLFKVIKPTRTGVILESLDGKNTKLIANAHNRISILEEISIYTTTGDGSVPLQSVMQKISKEFGDDLGLENKPDSEELKSFLKHVLPDYDSDRVYVSDIKKLVSWYNILLGVAPDTLKEVKKEKKTTKKKAPKKDK